MHFWTILGQKLAKLSKIGKNEHFSAKNVVFLDIFCNFWNISGWGMP